MDNEWTEWIKWTDEDGLQWANLTQRGAVNVWRVFFLNYNGRFQMRRPGARPMELLRAHRSVQVWLPFNRAVPLPSVGMLKTASGTAQLREAVLASIIPPRRTTAPGSDAGSRNK